MKENPQKQFEYLLIHDVVGLDEYGQDGWEVVASIEGHNPKGQLVLKREKQK